MAFPNPLSYVEMQQHILTHLQTHTQLVLLVDVADSTALLHQADPLNEIAYVNVSRELARQLRQQPTISPLDTATWLKTLLAHHPTTPILVDRLEILFTPALQLDVLRLLIELSRHTPILAVWPGEYREGRLIYATPGHPEYRMYEHPEQTFPMTILTLRR